jgi:hypothetical protein
MPTDDPDRIKNLARKVYRLSEDGRDGEAKAAKNRLNHLLDKYDLTLAEVIDDGEEKTDHFWTYKTRHERKLLQQIIYAVCGHFDGLFERTDRQGRGIPCTETEAADISEQYEYYRTLWKEELDTLQDAFIQRHNIFPDNPESGGSDLSDEEIYDILEKMSAFSGESFEEGEEEAPSKKLPKSDA